MKKSTSSKSNTSEKATVESSITIKSKKSNKNNTSEKATVESSINIKSKKSKKTKRNCDCAEYPNCDCNAYLSLVKLVYQTV